MTTTVFGASGQIGGHVARGLQASGARVRWVSRNPGTAGFPPDADMVAADLDRPETLTAALRGAWQVFLYAKPGHRDGKEVEIETSVTAAESAGVEHVVVLSSSTVVQVDPLNRPIPRTHALVEAAIEASSLDWTFVRPGLFATNAVWLWQHSIREEGIVRLPLPDALTAPVHEGDVAAVAVAAFTSPLHRGRAYVVTGPEALTVRQQVRHIGAAIGRDITVEVTDAGHLRAQLGKTLPSDAIEGILARWESGNSASPDISTSVQEVTGQPARTFAQWAHDHAADFG